MGSHHDGDKIRSDQSDPIRNRTHCTPLHKGPRRARPGQIAWNVARKGVRAGQFEAKKGVDHPLPVFTWKNHSRAMQLDLRAAG